MKTPLLVAATLAVSALAVPASAQQLSFSGSASVVSNYMSRGVTQSDNGPALQLGGEVTYGGFYGGLWASTVELGADNTELDISLGYRWEMGQATFDLGYVHYIYDDSGDAGGEVIGGLTIEDDTRSYVGRLTLSDEGRFADVNFGFGWEFVPATTFSASVGRATGDINYGSLGMGYAFTENFSVDANYEMTNAQRNRLVVGLHANF